MVDKKKYRDKILELQCCIIVPTFNNGATIGSVLDGISGFTDNIIIINDGSDDNTKEILSSYTKFDIITFEKNSGKGAALKEGFKFALDSGYKYAITMVRDDKIEGPLSAGAQDIAQED